MPTVGGRLDGPRGVNCDSCPAKRRIRAAGGAVNNIIENEYRETSLVGKEAFPILKHQVLISLYDQHPHFDGDTWPHPPYPHPLVSTKSLLHES